MSVNLIIGAITPPFGVILFILTKLPSELASLVLAFTKDPLMIGSSVGVTISRIAVLYSSWANLALDLLILAIINVLLLFLGCFMETTEAPPARARRT